MEIDSTQIQLFFLRESTVGFISLGRLDFLTLEWQPLLEKENSKFKPDVDLEMDRLR